MNDEQMRMVIDADIGREAMLIVMHLMITGDGALDDIEDDLGMHQCRDALQELEDGFLSFIDVDGDMVSLSSEFLSLGSAAQ